jgi:hypothetical protein
MYLSAERVAIVNRTIQETFEQTCIAWQAIPHWDTGDPGQTEVSNENYGVAQIQGAPQDVSASVAELIAPTPDSLLTKINAATVALAASVDDVVFPALRTAALGPNTFNLTASTTDAILSAVIDCRGAVEKGGYRSPSCGITNTDGIKGLYQLVNSYTSPSDTILYAGNINSVHRVDKLETAVGTPPASAIVLGRRQRIAHGQASGASPGEEPVDLAISVPPSFEIVGESAANLIRLRVRVRYAVRVKVPAGIALITGP